MPDRLKSVKLSRTLRNITFCLAAVFLLEFLLLLADSFLRSHRFLTPSLIFLLAAVFSGYLANYYHRRFRQRD